jgi:succinate dehydrogenase / fumarate reductase cytochrome b subunit
MAKPRPFFSTSIGTKVLIALTGLALVGFLVVHLAGNLLLFAGPAAFNHYAHSLTSKKVLLYAAEAGLVALFALHAWNAVTTTWRNRKARGTAYQRKERAGAPSRKGLASSTMIWSGLFVLVFLVLHLKTFKYGPWYTVADDAAVRDLYRLTVEVFSRPLYVGYYVLAMAVLGLHLWHGFASAFQSLGVDHPGLTGKILRLGMVVAVVLGLGFAIIPVGIFVTR